MNNWKEEYYVLIGRNYDIELETNVAIINFIENLLQETKKEERERIKQIIVDYDDIYKGEEIRHAINEMKHTLIEELKTNQ